MRLAWMYTYAYPVSVKFSSHHSECLENAVFSDVLWFLSCKNIWGENFLFEWSALNHQMKLEWAIDVGVAWKKQTFIKFQWKCIQGITQFSCSVMSFDGFWLTTRKVFLCFKKPQNMKVKWSFSDGKLIGINKKWVKIPTTNSILYISLI